MESSTPILTIWHNNIGRPIPCPGLPNGYAGRSGISPFRPGTPEAVAEFVRTMDRYGAAILVDDRHQRPANHRLIGVGTGHDDADWCESRFEQGSMASYYENKTTVYSLTEVLVARAAGKGK